MKAESVYFKGDICFKKDWVGFDTIKPINVIIGRNNSGKSQLLDLVKVLCESHIESTVWKIQCRGKLDEALLKTIFPENTTGGYLQGNHWTEHGIHLISAEISWEISGGSTLQVNWLDESVVQSPFGEESTRARTSVVARAANRPTHKLSGTRFRRLLADRDIRPEHEHTELALNPNGEGASNIIRRFILSSAKELPREVIQENLRSALNEIFHNDGDFSEIEANVHDEASEELINRWEVYLGEKSKGLVPLSQSGSGLKTVILVLLNLLVVPKIEKREACEYTFAFEELENNLHPALLRRLLIYLENFAVKQECAVFLTTHSSTALDVFGISDNAQIIHVSHDGEGAQATRVSAQFDQLSVVSELGAKPSDLLQANGIIWVEGPSDRVYLNRWIQIHSDGAYSEGRDYQCAFYGGSLLARTQFMPADGQADNKLANLLRVNPNIVVVCDSDRRAKGAHVKDRVKRIRKEVGQIPNAHIWVTKAKEIENYIPGSVLEAVFEKHQLPDPDQYDNFFPRKGARNKSYVSAHLKRKSISKVDLAMLAAEQMTKENMTARFDWDKQVRKVVEKIREWNT